MVSERTAFLDRGVEAWNFQVWVGGWRSVPLQGDQPGGWNLVGVRADRHPQCGSEVVCQLTRFLFFQPGKFKCQIRTKWEIGILFYKLQSRIQFVQSILYDLEVAIETKIEQYPTLSKYNVIYCYWGFSKPGTLGDSPKLMTIRLDSDFAISDQQ